MTITIEHIAFAWLCRGVSRAVYKTAPSPEYADRVWRFLLTTGLHESDGLAARRQYRFEFDSMSGARGVMQQEMINLRDCFQRLRADSEADVRERIADFAFRDTRAPGLFFNQHDDRDLSRLVIASDRLSVALARYYMIKFPGAMPGDGGRQSFVWSRDYNTRNEESKRLAWLRRYNEYTIPIIAALHNIADETGAIK